MFDCVYNDDSSSDSNSDSCHETFEEQIYERYIPMIVDNPSSNLTSWSLPRMAPSTKKMIASSPRWKKKKTELTEDEDSVLEYWGLCYEDLDCREEEDKFEIDVTTSNSHLFISTGDIRSQSDIDSELSVSVYSAIEPFLFGFVDEELLEETRPKSILRKSTFFEKISTQRVRFQEDENFSVRIFTPGDDGEEIEDVDVDIAYTEFRQFFPIDSASVSVYLQKWRVDRQIWRGAGGSKNGCRHGLSRRHNRN